MDLLQSEAQSGDISLRRVFDIMGDEGHGVLLLFLCLPYLQPIPIPGLSTPFGVLIAIIMWFLYLRKAPWLPQRFENLKISSRVILKVSEIAERIWVQVAKVVRARWIFFLQAKSFRILNLIMVVMNGLLLSLPLPIPFSNTMPAIAIIFYAIGQMEKDGLFVCLSYVWSLIVAGFFLTLALGASWAVVKIT